MNYHIANIKLLTGISLLLAFVSIGVFGLLQFNHSSHSAETPMVNCPYAQNSFSLCESNFGHINNWRQFLNVIFPTLLVFSILLFAVLYIFDQKFFNQEKHSYRWKYYLDNKKLYSYPQEIIKWLSLFENSPSFQYARHS
ncbi:hypothetical protein A3G98_01240 [Candidatus Nomurabacteria bacterium RIFCSPLOWO2_12_FULL_37_8]|nr:MAG: hypothetical protein A3A92_00960 [Candidatus Nomurabacteria bacterium RIFCSPLOWO2_01_FULL_37_49]OGJ01902.1 MAG: hypothetical protein A3G98_01240 [Candidatus Nomurabacteria bacterium RIFCSPLOWO2_12_FULL_37_8]